MHCDEHQLKKDGALSKKRSILSMLAMFLITIFSVHRYFAKKILFLQSFNLEKKRSFCTESQFMLTMQWLHPFHSHDANAYKLTQMTKYYTLFLHRN